MHNQDAASIQQAILDARFLPLFSTTDLQIAKTVLLASYQAGIRTFEFTNRTANAAALFAELKKFCSAELPDLLLGIGTIKSAEQAQQFIDLGADFLISPLLLREIFDVTDRYQKFWIPGCATATEIGTAEAWGVRLVKIFPARQLGGPAFIKAVKAVFPQMHFLVTGGVEPDEKDLHAWFDSGADAAGIGSQLFPKGLLNNSDALYGHLKKITRAIENYKRAT